MSNNIRTEYVNKSEDLSVSKDWWDKDQADMASSVFAVVNGIEQQQSYRQTQNLKFARLYSNYEMLGLGLGKYAVPSNDTFLKNRVTLNVIKSSIDTLASKISKNKPKITFLTSEGDWSEQQKAKKLTKYMLGTFKAIDAYKKAQQCFRDACVWGMGALKVYTDETKGEVKLDRVLPTEIVVDDHEGIYGYPRQLHQTRHMFKDVLIEMFPEHKFKIEAAQTENAGYGSKSMGSEMVKVVESWHLPSGPEAGDGKHAISIKDQTLWAEDYNKTYFPFVFFRWSERLLGFYGQGVAEELVGIQLEINKLLKNIQKAQHLMAVPRVFVENGSAVNTSHINNDIGGIVKYTGRVPSMQTANAMPSEVYNHLENLYQKAFQIVGISQLSAASQKPSGLDSGVALREFQDIESERFMLTGQRYENMFLELARIIIDLSRDLYTESNKDMVVKAKGDSFIQTIKWSEVDLPDDRYTMDMYPTNLLPNTPAGRLQTVQELVQAGLIDQKQALSLLDFPDLEKVLTLKNAAIDNINRILDKIVDEKEYTTPEPYMDLELAIRLSQQYYLKAQNKGADEEVLSLLRQFIDQATQLLQRAQAPVQAPMPGEGGQPIAQPEQAPQSDLMPLETAAQAPGNQIPGVPSA